MRGLLYLLCDFLIVKQIVLHVKMFRKKLLRLHFSSIRQLERSAEAASI